jgi:hypothetical protein
MGCGGAKHISAPTVTTKTLKWGAQGKVKLKTIKFKAVYNPATQEVDIDLSSNQVAESLLAWNGTTLSIVNTKVIDFETQEETTSPPLKLEFTVSAEGKYNQISNGQEYCKTLGEFQGHPHLTPQQNAFILKAAGAEAAVLWGKFYEYWLEPSLKLNKVTSYEKAAVRTVKNITRNQEDLEQFLAKKYAGEELDIKAATVEESVAVVLEETTMRPHTVKVRNSRYVVFNSPMRNVIEMTEEIVLTMFCWSDIPEIGGLTALSEEYKNLNKGISSVLDQFNLSVSALRHV